MKEAAHSPAEKFVYERENARLAMEYRRLKQENAALKHRIALLEEADLTLYNYLIQINPFVPERLKKEISKHVSIR